MLFNSFEFLIFLPVVFMLYWFVANKNLRLQNALVVLASYVFYGWWDWRFLSLILFSTFVDYSIGRALGKEENERKRKMLLWGSIAVNLGFLGVFKYYNFFLDSLYDTIPGLQVLLGFNTLDVILPVGISFYTFQTMSYSIDVYRRKLEPTKDIIAFAAFVGFFPQLVAGPIERATNLLPQFYKKRSFDRGLAAKGMRQILWGLFKKIVIADNCAVYANLIFNNSEDYGGSTLLIGAVFFAFQIYGDFSGYSDIAIGVSRLFGLDLRKNFAYPYFSRNMAEFWRRWHISLSTWFRDYLYIPLGGSRGGRGRILRNIFIIFLLSGFWHGANWTFIAWGGLNALYFIPLLLTKNNRKHLEIVAPGKKLPSWREAFSILFTFGLAVLAWIFFRAENLKHAFDYIGEIFSSSFLSMPAFIGERVFLSSIFLIGLFMLIEWMGREQEFAIERMGLAKRKVVRYAAYYLLVLLIFTFKGGEQVFIYFQF